MSQSASSPSNTAPWRRDEFKFFELITLRWADNDSYGHINNAHYYSFFDTAVDAFLLANDLRKHLRDPYQTLVVASECRYHSQVSAPGNIEVGVRAGRLGNSSITYEVAVFTKDSDLAAAQGKFVHVCVERATQRPAPIPERFRQSLASLPDNTQNQSNLLNNN